MNPSKATLHSEATQDEAPVTLVIRDVRVEAITTFGNTYFREDQLAAAFGYSFLSYFRSVIADANLYSGAKRDVELMTEKGFLPVTVFTLSGAHQVCLFIRSRCTGERATRALELLDLLQQLRSPRKIGEGA